MSINLSTAVIQPWKKPTNKGDLEALYWNFMEKTQGNTFFPFELWNWKFKDILQPTVFTIFKWILSFYCLTDTTSQIRKWLPIDGGRLTHPKFIIFCPEIWNYDPGRTLFHCPTQRSKNLTSKGCKLQLFKRIWLFNQIIDIFQDFKSNFNK